MPNFQLDFSIELKRLLDKHDITAACVILERHEMISMVISNEGASIFIDRFSTDTRKQLEELNNGPAQSHIEFIIKGTK